MVTFPSAQAAQRRGVVLASAASSLLLLLLSSGAGRSEISQERSSKGRRTAADELAQVVLWDSHMSLSLCATQAVKLPDCETPPLSHAASNGKFSPYKVHGKALPWKTGVSVLVFLFLFLRLCLCLRLFLCVCVARAFVRACVYVYGCVCICVVYAS